MAIDRERKFVLHQQRDADFWQALFHKSSRNWGQAEGEITGEEIVIAQSALVTARIRAKRLRVAGQVTGEIVAHECIELLPTACVRGTFGIR
jgi:hypothetical protein